MQARAGARGEAGIALPMTLILLVVLASLAAAVLAVGTSEVNISSNHVRAAQAFYLAEAGLEAAFARIRDDTTLVGSAPASSTTLDVTPPAAPLSSYGSYAVRYRAAGDHTVEIVSTGTSSSGSSHRVLRSFLTTAFDGQDAIRSKLNISMAGDSHVEGACGSVHANGNLSINGNPNVTNNATATGSYTAVGHPSIGGTAGGGRAAKTVPDVNPASFLSAAQARLPANEIFQMKSDGRVLDGNGNVLSTLSNGASYRNWRYTAGSPAQWALTGNTGLDGFYYLEGNATVSGNPGSPGNPWNTSLVSTGTMTISGNAEINVKLTDTLFVSGGNMTVSGNPSNGFNGVIASGGSATLSGNPTISGYVLAEGSVTVSGSPSITYGCGLHPPIDGPLAVLTWGL